MTQLLIHEEGDERLVYYPDFFTSSYYNQLIEALSWKQNEIRVFGKLHLEPRHTAWYGPAYRYSSIQWPAQAMHPLLNEIAEPIHQLTSFPFNSVLANHYRNGSDSMGWHSDNEPEMDTALIASATFGGTRTLKFRHKQSRQIISLELLDRSLLLMYNMQDHWQHAIPKSKRQMQARINLTYRHIWNTEIR
jgi:alkylated DNA repair dioxygenase AlkB